MKNKKIIFSALLMFFFAENAQAVAMLSNPLGTNVTTVPQLIGQILNYILGFTGAVALVVFIYGGFVWMISGGEKDRIEKGKNALVWATIGLAVIFSSYAMLNFIQRALTGT